MLGMVVLLVLQRKVVWFSMIISHPGLGQFATLLD